MNIEELRKIFCEDGLYAVCIENGCIVSCCPIQSLRSSQQKSGAALFYFVDNLVTDGVILREDEFVTSLRMLKEAAIKAGFSAFADE
ncbi:hypothetical protein NGB58_25400 [Escherichia coli]|nr:hypothetical protein [Escherichia coli]